MHLPTLATLACIAVSASAFQYPDFVPLHRRQDPGTPAYECHANCGGIITAARTEGYCDTSDFKTKLSACLDCALAENIWQYYGTSVTKAAKGCGLDATPVESSNEETSTTVSASASASETAQPTTAPASTTSAAGTTAGTSTSVGSTAAGTDVTSSSSTSLASSSASSLATSASASSSPIIGASSSPASSSPIASATPSGNSTGSETSPSVPLHTGGAAGVSRSGVMVGVVLGAVVAVFV